MRCALGACVHSSPVCSDLYQTYLAAVLCYGLHVLALSKCL